MVQLLSIVNLIITFLFLALIARAILSWIPNGWNNPIGRFLFKITEPILQPIRNVLPRTGGFDLSPMIAVIVLVILQRFIGKLIGT